jgi:hypothetical protein
VKVSSMLERGGLFLLPTRKCAPSRTKIAHMLSDCCSACGHVGTGSTATDLRSQRDVRFSPGNNRMAALSYLRRDVVVVNIC